MKFFLFFIIIICFSCKSSKEITREEKVFKYYYFKSCLKYGFNKSDEIIKILSQDKSYNSDFALGLRNYKFLDSLAQKEVIKIKQDSIKSLTTAHKSAQGKRVFEKCLCDFNSKWLDSITAFKLQNRLLN